MINIYTKSGTLKGVSVISIILKSQKYKWTKAFRVDHKLPDNSFTKSIILDALSVLYALKHVRDRYRKKKVVVHNDSNRIALALKTNDDEEGEYTNKTSIQIIEYLRDMSGTFSNLSLDEFSEKCEHKKELEHIFIECALDNIELDEKD